MQKTIITSIIMTITSVLTSLSITFHDAHAEQCVAAAATHLTAVQSYAELESDGHPRATSTSTLTSQHTHADYNPLSQTLSNTFSYQSPSVAPKRDSHHKQLLRTLEIGGRHAFDNSNLPILT